MPAAPFPFMDKDNLQNWKWNLSLLSMLFPSLLICASGVCDSYYCLLFFMIGFHIQYDFLTTVLRTSKGHLPYSITFTISPHGNKEKKKIRSQPWWPHLEAYLEQLRNIQTNANALKKQMNDGIIPICFTLFAYWRLLYILTRTFVGRKEKGPVPHLYCMHVYIFV